MPAANSQDKATDAATKGENHGHGGESNAEKASGRGGPLKVGGESNTTPSKTSNDMSTLMGSGQGRHKITQSQDSKGRPKGF